LFTGGINQILMAVIVLYISAVLGPKEFGIFSLSIGFKNLIAPIITFGLGSTYMRYLHRYYKNGQGFTYVKRILGICGLSFIAASTLLILTSRLWVNTYFPEPVSTWLLFCVVFGMLAQIFYNHVQYLLVALEKLYYRANAELFYALLMTFLVYLISKLRSDAIFLLLALFIPMFIVSVGFMIRGIIPSFVGTQNQTINEPSFLKRKLSFSIGHTLAPTVVMLLFLTDRWIVGNKLGSIALGEYAFAAAFSLIIYQMNRYVLVAFIPGWNRKWDNEKREVVQSQISFVFRINVVILTAICAVVLLTRTSVFIPLFGQKYAVALMLLPYVFTGRIIFTLYTLISIYAAIIERTFMFVPILSICVVLNAVFCLIGVSTLGIFGAQLGVILSIILITIGTVLQARALGLTGFGIADLRGILIPTVLLLPEPLIAVVCLVGLPFVALSNFVFTKPERIKIIQQIKSLATVGNK